MLNLIFAHYYTNRTALAVSAGPFLAGVYSYISRLMLACA